MVQISSRPFFSHGFTPRQQGLDSHPALTVDDLLGFGKKTKKNKWQCRFLPLASKPWTGSTAMVDIKAGRPNLLVYGQRVTEPLTSVRWPLDIGREPCRYSIKPECNHAATDATYSRYDSVHMDARAIVVCTSQKKRFSRSRCAERS